MLALGKGQTRGRIGKICIETRGSTSIDKFAINKDRHGKQEDRWLDEIWPQIFARVSELLHNVALLAAVSEHGRRRTQGDISSFHAGAVPGRAPCHL
jgi:hypothetical protein